MGSRDFYTDDEIKALEAYDMYGPEIEVKALEISKQKKIITKLREENDRLRLRLDDALDKCV